MKDRKKRNLAIGLLCCMLVFMGVGFAILNSNLNINGTATAVNTWNIVIDSIIPIDNDTAATSVSTEIKASRAEASFAVDFTKPGDYLEYEVIVSNEGSIGGYLESVKLEFENPENTDNSLFKITNDAEEGTAINAGESISFKVRIEFDSEADRMPTSSVNFNLYTNVVQKLEQGGQIPDEEDWTFKVDESGTLIAYNYEKGTDVVVPAEVDGIPVKAISSNAFSSEYNVAAIHTGFSQQLKAVVFDNQNYDELKSYLINYLNVDSNGVYTSDEAKSLGYSEMDYIKFYLDYSSNTITKDRGGKINLDLSNAIHLERLEDGAFFVGVNTLNFGSISSLRKIGMYSFGMTGLTGDLMLPEGITSIGYQAFIFNDLNSVTIPSTIEEIEPLVFYANSNLSTIKINKTQSDFENNVSADNWYISSVSSLEFLK